MGGRYTATTQGFQGGDSVVLAVTYPWAPASSYLSSQSVADSRCNPHATPRSSYSRRSPSRRFFLCRSALPCLVLHRHCCLSVPCSRGFSCLSAQFRSPRCVLWPLKFIQLPSRQNDSSDAHSDHLPPRQVVTQVHSFFDHLCLYRRRRHWNSPDRWTAPAVAAPPIRCARRARAAAAGAGAAPSPLTYVLW